MTVDTKDKGHKPLSARAEKLKKQQEERNKSYAKNAGVVEGETVSDSGVSSQEPNSTGQKEGEMVVKLDCHDITPNPHQNRRDFDAEGLAELAASIKENGQNQPIVVRKFGSKYQIVSGERRWRACSKLPGQTVDAIVRDVSDIEMIYLCYSENSGRKKIYDYERSLTIKDLLEQGESVDNIVKRIGVHKADYYSISKFDNLDESVKAALDDFPKALGRAEAREIAAMQEKVDVDDIAAFNKATVNLISEYQQGKIKSRGEIVKRLKAEFGTTKTRNRPKQNVENAIFSNSTKVGTIVDTPNELRLVVDKTEVGEDVLNELRSMIQGFLSKS